MYGKKMVRRSGLLLRLLVLHGGHGQQSSHGLLFVLCIIIIIIYNSD